MRTRACVLRVQRGSGTRADGFVTFVGVMVVSVPSLLLNHARMECGSCLGRLLNLMCAYVLYLVRQSEIVRCVTEQVQIRGG